MSKLERLSTLFRKGFDTESIEHSKDCDFICPHKDECKVNDGDPIFTPYIGHEDTDVMIIGEAPSRSGYINNQKFCSKKARIGGLMRDAIGDSNDDNQNTNTISQLNPFVNFVEFVKNNYAALVDSDSVDFKYPYFTDIMKCGFKLQSDKNAGILKARIENCTKQFLSEEINIMQPKVVLCIGRMAAETIKPSSFANIFQKTRIINLLHYSGSASLPLMKDSDRDINDKHIIWKIQAGLVEKENIPAELMKLGFIRNITEGQS